MSDPFERSAQATAWANLRLAPGHEARDSCDQTRRTVFSIRWLSSRVPTGAGTGTGQRPSTTYDPDHDYQVAAIYLPTAAGREHQSISAYDSRHRLTGITHQLCVISTGHSCSSTTATGSDTYAYDDEFPKCHKMVAWMRLAIIGKTFVGRGASYRFWCY